MDCRLLWPGFHPYTDGRQRIPVARNPKRVIRGGAWPYPASFLRVANRGGSPVGIRAKDRGFRLAR